MDFSSISLPDLAIALLAILAVWAGFFIGFPKLLLWTWKWCGSIVASFFLGQWIGPGLESWLPLSEAGSLSLAWMLCFLLIFGLVDLALRWKGWQRLHTKPGLASRIGGALWGLVLAGVLAVVLSFAFSISEQGGLRKAIAESWLASRLAGQAAEMGRQHDYTAMTNAPFGRIDASLAGEPPVSNPYLAAMLLDSVNALREGRGLPPLMANKVLELAALHHAQDMLARRYFSHKSPEGFSPFDRLNRLHIPYGQAGENLALAANPAQAHQALVNSPTHLENLLRPQFRRVGIVAIPLRPGRLLIVQEFSN